MNLLFLLFLLIIFCVFITFVALIPKGEKFNKEQYEKSLLEMERLSHRYR